MVCAELFFFCVFWFLCFFLKIGILENWNFGFFDFLGYYKISWIAVVKSFGIFVPFLFVFIVGVA